METAPEVPTTNPLVVTIVVSALAIITFSGLLGTIYLCHTSNDPLLVAAAVKMIQTDPSSAMAALMLLRADAAIIAIVSGLTGVALGQLGGVLSSSRTQRPGSNEAAKILTSTKTETTTQTTTAPPVAKMEPAAVTIEQPTDQPIPVTETPQT